MVADIYTGIKESMQLAGFKTTIVSIAHLPEARAAITRLVIQGLVSRRLSENWKFYLEANDGLPEAKTIIITAMPQPVVRVAFRWQGKDFPAEIAPGYFSRSDEARVEELLQKTLAADDYKMVRAHLPLKTLAVRSGLAEYGRNNIAYVSGMGSFCRLAAFYSDCPCEEDSWGDYRIMSACTDCSICCRNCPAGSIGEERFLIHAENCLGFLGQRQPNFPYWVRLQPDWENGLVGCMSCQLVCPVNQPYRDNAKEGPSFSEEETGQIRKAMSLDRLQPETRRKLSDISEYVYPLIASNLRELIDRRFDFV